MTKEQTNWEQEFEVTFNLLKLDNSQEYNLNKWAKEKMFESISKIISQEKEKMDKDFDGVVETLKTQINIWKNAYTKMEKDYNEARKELMEASQEKEKWVKEIRNFNPEYGELGAAIPDFKERLINLLQNK